MDNKSAEKVLISSGSSFVYPALAPDADSYLISLGQVRCPHGREWLQSLPACPLPSL